MIISGLEPWGRPVLSRPQELVDVDFWGACLGASPRIPPAVPRPQRALRGLAGAPASWPFTSLSPLWPLVMADGTRLPVALTTGLRLSAAPPYPGPGTGPST